MTPQERQLVDDLFDRLARLEQTPRDAEAERAIIEGLQRAPNAIYALVQTVLLQDEALRRAEARIRELTGEEAPAGQGGGFLDSMRAAFLARTGTSVPSVRPGASNEPDPRWNRGGAYAGGPFDTAQAAPGQSGGSFLGTAAASAAGVIGGALLFNMLGSMLGQRGGSALADVSSSGSRPSPWDDGAARSDLAREAGLNDIGRGVDNQQRAGLFGFDDEAKTAEDNSDFGDDFDGGDFGGSDTA